MNMLNLCNGKLFNLCHGLHIWDYAAAQPDYNDLFNKAMACNASIVTKAILSKYEGFRGLNSLVGVGGGTGTTVAYRENLSDYKWLH